LFIGSRSRGSLFIFRSSPAVAPPGPSLPCRPRPRLARTFEGTIQTMMRGTIEWTGTVQRLEGEVRPLEEPLEFTFRAFGRPGTETDGWDFGYHGRLTRHWPKGVAQRPALNCFRPHDLTYGWAYPFIAVKQ
jgi:hypothetical protein